MEITNAFTTNKLQQETDTPQVKVRKVEGEPELTEQVNEADNKVAEQQDNDNEQIEPEVIDENKNFEIADLSKKLFILMGYDNSLSVTNITAVFKIDDDERHDRVVYLTKNAEDIKRDLKVQFMSLTPSSDFVQFVKQIYKLCKNEDYTETVLDVVAQCLKNTMKSGDTTCATLLLEAMSSTKFKKYYGDLVYKLSQM